MGMDFCALLKCSSQEKVRQNAITLLEHEPPTDGRKVKEHWQRSGFSSSWNRKAAWVPRYSAEPGIIVRPSLPNLQLALRTDDDFFLTFGTDAVCIYHPLRWLRLLTDPEWQVIMLNACNAFADLFESTEGIITRDESPIIISFFQGASFQDSLAAGTGEESKVHQLSDLYELIDPDGTWDSHGYFMFRNAEKKLPGSLK